MHELTREMERTCLVACYHLEREGTLIKLCWSWVNGNRGCIKAQLLPRDMNVNAVCIRIVLYTKCFDYSATFRSAALPFMWNIVCWSFLPLLLCAACSDTQIDRAWDSFQTQLKISSMGHVTGLIAGEASNSLHKTLGRCNQQVLARRCHVSQSRSFRWPSQRVPGVPTQGLVRILTMYCSTSAFTS